MGSALKTLSLFFLVFTVPAAVFAEKVTYSGAVSRMLAGHGEFLAADENVQSYGYKKKAVSGLHWPVLTVDGHYTVINDDLVLKTGLPFPPPIGTQEFSYEIQKKYFARASANVTWPLFTGGKVSAANYAAQSYIDEAVSGREELRNSLSHDLASKYFGLQLATEAKKLREEVRDGLREHYNNAVKLEKAGMIPRVELLHAEVSLSEAERSYRQAVQDEDIAKTALKNLLVMDAEPEPSTPLFLVDPSLLRPLDYYLSLLGSNPQMMKIEAYKDLSAAAVKESDATYMPTIFLFGSYEIYRADLTVIDPEWTAGIGANWTLFEGFTGHNTALAAKKARQGVLYKSAQARRDMSAAAEVYYKQVLKAYEQYAAAKDSLNFTGEYLRVRQKAFESGMATSVDVVDARMALSRNRLEVLSAAYDFDMALSKLLSLCGIAPEYEKYVTNPSAEVIE